MLLEVIVQSVADAEAAQAGGADRLEIVRALDREGLTPPLGLVRAILNNITIPARAILRERDDFALEGPSDLRRLERAAAALADLGCDGIVLGFTQGERLDLGALDRLLAAAPSLPATLHRAFDAVRHPLAAISEVRLRIQVDRILTSGGAGDLSTRARRLRSYVMEAGSRPVIIAGGGLDERCLRELAALACVDEVHVGRAARIGSDPASPVSADLVRRLKDIVTA